MLEPFSYDSHNLSVLQVVVQGVYNWFAFARFVFNGAC